jgi:AAA domain
MTPVEERKQRAEFSHSEEPYHAPDCMESERAVLATVLASAIESGTEYPPAIKALLSNAPDSFSDGQLGRIAKCIRQMQDEGLPASPMELARRLPDDATVISALPDEGLVLDFGEVEAKRVLEIFQARKLWDTYRRACDSIQHSPAKTANIASHVRTVEDSLFLEPSEQSAWLSLAEDAGDIVKATIPPPVEIIEGIVTDRSKLVIASSAKAFKTWTTIYAALAISHGVPFLERKTLRRRVLYLNLELKGDTFKRRVQAIAQKLDLKTERGWFTHLPLRGAMAGISSVGDLVSRIIQVVQECKAEVVVLDPLYKANVQGEENNSRDQTLLFNQLDRITTEVGATLILNDHSTKGNQSDKDPLDVIRGSSAKGGDVDAAMILRKHEIDGCYSVDLVHRELPPVEPFVIGWDYPLMKLRPDLSPKAMKRAAAGGRNPEHNVVELLAFIRETTQSSGISTGEWAERAGIKRSTLNDYLEKMRSSGWIATAGEGSHARKFITQKGLDILNGQDRAVSE